jgi:hypothetical protein
MDAARSRAAIRGDAEVADFLVRARWLRRAIDRLCSSVIASAGATGPRERAISFSRSCLLRQSWLGVYFGTRGARRGRASRLAFVFVVAAFGQKVDRWILERPG